MLKINLTKRERMLVAIFVVALAVGVVFLIKKPKAIEQEQSSEMATQKETNSPTPKVGAAQQAKTYGQLVDEYQGRRIQFDINCQAIPNNVTFKNGTKVMFDNRSGDQRNITIGGVVYNFAGYGYKMLTLSSATLPKTLLLSCGAAVNVGQILIQK